MKANSSLQNTKSRILRCSLIEENLLCQSYFLAFLLTFINNTFFTCLLFASSSSVVASSLRSSFKFLEDRLLADGVAMSAFFYCQVVLLLAFKAGGVVLASTRAAEHKVLKPVSQILIRLFFVCLELLFSLSTLVIVIGLNRGLNTKDFWTTLNVIAFAVLFYGLNLAVEITKVSRFSVEKQTIFTPQYPLFLFFKVLFGLLATEVLFNPSTLYLVIVALLAQRYYLSTNMIFY